MNTIFVLILFLVTNQACAAEPVLENEKMVTWQDLSVFSSAITDGDCAQVATSLKPETAQALMYSYGVTFQVSPLLYAVADHRFDIAGVLVKAGAKVNEQHVHSQHTALTLAGANVAHAVINAVQKIKDDAGKENDGILVQDKEVKELLANHKTLVELLIEYRADVTRQSRLHKGTEKSNVAVYGPDGSGKLAITYAQEVDAVLQSPQSASIVEILKKETARQTALKDVAEQKTSE